jgi:hypothetical protein
VKFSDNKRKGEFNVPDHDILVHATRQRTWRQLPSRTANIPVFKYTILAVVLQYFPGYTEWTLGLSWHINTTVHKETKSPSQHIYITNEIELNSRRHVSFTEEHPSALLDTFFFLTRVKRVLACGVCSDGMTSHYDFLRDTYDWTTQ